MIKITNQDIATVTSLSKAAEASDAALFSASMQQAVQRGAAADTRNAGVGAQNNAELPKGAEKSDRGSAKTEANEKPEDGAKTAKTEKADRDDKAKDTGKDDKDIKDKDIKNEEKPAINEEAGAQAVPAEQQAAQDAQVNNSVQDALLRAVAQQSGEQVQQGTTLQEEAVQTAGTEAMSAQVQPVSEEQLDFVGKVLGEIEQQVVSNEAEHTEPAAIQAQGAAETTPQAQTQPEEEFTAAGYDLHKEENKAKSAAAEAPATHQSGAAINPTGTAVGNIPGDAVTVELPEGAQEARQAVFDNLLSQVESAVSEERSELYIRFKPEVFGGMSIRLSMSEEGVRAQIRTSDPTMRGMINSELAQLTDTLRARGIDIVDMDVMYEQTANNQFLDQRSGQWQGQREQGGGGAQTFTNEASEDRAYEAAYERMIPVSDENSAGVVYDA